VNADVIFSPFHKGVGVVHTALPNPLDTCNQTMPSPLDPSLSRTMKIGQMKLLRKC
jgi:hypothetical protein